MGSLLRTLRVEWCCMRPLSRIFAAALPILAIVGLVFALVGCGPVFYGGEDSDAFWEGVRREVTPVAREAAAVSVCLVVARRYHASSLALVAWGVLKCDERGVPAPPAPEPPVAPPSAPETDAPPGPTQPPPEPDAAPESATAALDDAGVP